MQTSKRQDVSRGILAFAQNTEQTDYIGIANKTLALASKVLGLPYTLITNVDQRGKTNTRYSIDTQQFVEWKNIGRHSAYSLTPYDETLVIDVDYIVQDRELLKIFEQEFDYRLLRHSHALTQDYPNSMGPNSLPFVWATVFAFRKTKKSEIFFNLVKRIQENYGYYCALYNVQERNYRNDYAFAMADYIVNGYTILTETIPGSMLTVDQPINSIEVTDSTYIIRDNNKAYIAPKTNLHIMSKAYLQSENFAEFIKNVTA